MSAEAKVDWYVDRTSAVVALLEAGVVPWHAAWPAGRLPANFVVRIPYRGLTALLLACLPYRQPYYLSEYDVGRRGGQVRAGARSYSVMVWRSGRRARAAGGGGRGPARFLCVAQVYNVEQCSGLDVPPLVPPRTEAESVAAAERVLAQLAGGLEAVTLPDAEVFDGPEKYYRAAFHRLVHATAEHPGCEREVGGGFECGGAGREELVADIGAGLLCGRAGLAPASVPDLDAYVARWAPVLKQQPRMVVNAGQAAQRAVDAILNVKWEQGSDAR